MVVSPDVGGVVRARAMAKRLDCDLAIIDKRRPKPNVAKVMHIIGDVKDRTCIIMDDMVDTANTLCEAANALKEHGARKVMAYCHPSGAVRQRGRAHRQFRARRTGGDRHHSAARRRARMRQQSASCRWPNCWRKPSAASATKIPSVRCSWSDKELTSSNDSD